MAATLPNGNVLAAGGFNARAILASAEVFNPHTGLWSSTGAMKAARYGATMTLLPNGKVLVAGGFTEASPDVSATAEVYNPATGTWSRTGSMFAARASHTATLLANGMVLVAGGVGTDQSFAIASAELYNPSTGSWSQTASMSIPRERHGAGRLPNGQVLVSGGNLDYLSGAEGGAETYDPASGHWSMVGRMMTSRLSHTETVLADGSVLVTGGVYGNIAGFNYLASSDRFDPQTDRWFPTGDMQIATRGIPTISGRESQTATTLADGRVLVAGGDGYLTDFTRDVIFATAELYDPTSGAWALTGSMNVARSEHAAVQLQDGRVLVLGGSTSGARPLASAEIYTPTASRSSLGLTTAWGGMAPRFVVPQGNASFNASKRAWGRAPNPFVTLASARTSIGKWTQTGSMHVARIGAPATLLLNGKVLVEGCDALTGKTAELYDPASGTWTRTGSMHFPRCDQVAILLPNGHVLVAGGLGLTNGVFSSAEIYDPSTGMWHDVKHMNSTRYLSTIDVLSNGEVVVAGGNAINGIPRDSADLFNPATGTWTATPSLNLSRNSHSSAILRNGKVLVMGGFTQNNGLTMTSELYDPVSNTWSFTGSTEQQSLRMVSLLTGEVLSADEPGNGPTGTTSELYDPSTGAWTPTHGKMHFPRANDTVTGLSDGSVLVAGGCYGINCTFIAQAELFNPANQRWTLDAPLITPRESHSEALLADGRVLVAGGYSSHLQPLASAEIYKR
jgi:N-acetylneuraminic acid mutarotase